MTQNLMDKLKIALGRQLSPKQMVNARIMKESEGFSFMVESDKPMKIDRLDRFLDETFMRFRQKFSYMITPDASHGEKHSHEGYYSSKTIEEIYDSEGRLEEKTVSNGNLYIGVKTVTKVFNPSGRLIGRSRKLWHIKKSDN